jgi:Tol biopolymer transport system component
MASLVLLVGGISVGAPDASTSGRDIAADEPEPVIEGVTHGSRWLVDVRDRSATSLPLSLRPVFATDYAVSPNRRRVAFTAPDPDGAVGATRIFVARRTGSRVRALTPAAEGVMHPAWAPDGRSIVFVDGDSLALVDLRSGRVRRIGDRHLDPVLPSFSADGRSILFTSTTPPAIWTRPVRGGVERALVWDAVFGSWSSDGSRLAFLRASDPSSGFKESATERLARRDPRYRELRARQGYLMMPYPRVRLWLAAADGARARVIRKAGSMRGRVDGDLARLRPVWSPDGRHIALDVGGAVLLVHARSGRVTDIGCGRKPAWWDVRHLLIEGYDPDCDGDTTESA